MKIFKNIIRQIRVEKISNYTVDKDVQSMLWPLNLMQYIMFCPKYRIKNDLITQNSLISNLISMIVTVVYLSTYFYTTVTEDAQSLGFPTFLNFSCFNECLVFGCGFCMNFVIGVIQTKNNVQFILTFQKVHRFLNAGANVNHFVVGNWILGITALGFYVIIYTIFWVQMGASFSSIYVAYFLVFYDFNIVYATRILKLLENQVCLWSFKVTICRELEDTQTENDYKKVFQAYVEILECYRSYKVCYQPLVSRTLNF